MADVHSIEVWRVDVESMPGDLDALADCLDASEQQRAARFRSAADRRRFLVAHAALRCLLARRLRRSARSLRFDQGEHGKPALRDPQPPPWFNLSHSGRWALCALSDAAPIGVDVEQPRDSPDHIAIAHRWFTPSECAALRDLPPAQRGAGFRRLWVCKEALLKSDGQGISGGLDRFELGLTATGVRLLRVGGSEQAAHAWSLLTFDLGDDYAGAVAAPRSGLCVRIADLPHAGLEQALRELD